MEYVKTNTNTSLSKIVYRIGIPAPLLMGFIGFTFFMVGDGIELGFLASFLKENGFTPNQVALLFTVYGVSASISAWLSGALSDSYGPAKVMWAGLIIWIIFEIAF